MTEILHKNPYTIDSLRREQLVSSGFRSENANTGVATSFVIDQIGNLHSVFYLQKRGEQIIGEGGAQGINLESAIVSLPVSLRNEYTRILQDKVGQEVVIFERGK